MTLTSHHVNEEAEDDALTTSAAATYFQYKMLFAGLIIFLASSHRPPAFAAFILEEVERRDFAVGAQHFQRAFLAVLGRLRYAIQIHCDRACTTTAKANGTFHGMGKLESKYLT